MGAPFAFTIGRAPAAANNRNQARPLQQVIPSKRTAAMASLVLLAVACSSPSASNPASGARTGQTPTAAFSFEILAAPGTSSASAARTADWITCSGAIGWSDPVAIVQLHSAANTGEPVLPDYLNPSTPRTLYQSHTQGPAHGYWIMALTNAAHVAHHTVD